MFRATTRHVSSLPRASWNLYLPIILLGLIILGITAIPAGASESISPNSGTEINECTTINESGEYVLAGDLHGNPSGSCLEISDTESVVLDGKGYAIRNVRMGVDIRDSSNIVVKNLSVNGSETYGIGIWHSESVEVHGNTISDTGTRQGWQNNSIHAWESTNIEIYDNTIINTLGRSDGIYVARVSSTHIYQNKVENASSNGINVIQSENIGIYKNNLSNIGRRSGANISGNSGITSWNSSDIEIYTNTLVNTSNVGIRTGRTNDVYIYRNNLINTHWWSIFPGKGKNIVIDQNTVKHPDTDGNAIAFSKVIKVTTTNNSIDQTRYGIEAKPNSTDVVIRGNNITNTVECSIEAEGGKDGRVNNVVIEDNFIESAGPLGVWVNTSDIVVRNNIVKHARGLGMYVKGIDGNVEIYGNLFFNSRWAAIRTDETHGNLRIYENDFQRLHVGFR